MILQAANLLKNLKVKLPFNMQFRAYKYEMPEHIRNSFYLANSSCFDNANWFIQQAYEVVFNDLVDELKDRDPRLNPEEARTKVLNILKVLEWCNVVIDTHYPVKLKNDNLQVIRAYRAQHGKYKSNLPSLGGLRIGAKITKDEVKAMAALSTYRYACLGIDMAGSCGGIKINPVDYDRDDLKVILQSYAMELGKRGLYGEFTDVIKPDFCTGSEEMTWIGSTEVTPSDRFGKACTVGQQFESGGLENYEKSGSHGVQFGLNYFLKHKNIMEQIGLQAGLEKKTFIIQGLGKIGEQIGTYMEACGAICVGAKEIDAYVYDANGFSFSEILSYKKKNGSIVNFNLKTKPYQTDTVLTEECDILILAANRKSLIYFMADKVKAKIIVEIAHGSITPSAFATLVGRQKLVLPDIFMSSGYSLASNFEYLKNSIHDAAPTTLTRSFTRDVFKDLINNVQRSTKVDQSNLQLKEKPEYLIEQKLLNEAMEYVMEKTARDILKIAEKYGLGLNLRAAAYVKAIKNLFAAIYDSKSCL